MSANRPFPISHITFIVSDLDRMKNLMEQVLGGREIYDSGEKNFSIAREKFFLIGGPEFFSREPEHEKCLDNVGSALWIAIMKGETAEKAAPKTYDHIAFRVDEREMPKLAEKIAALGLRIESGRSRVKGEGGSIYFYDWDGHLFELHAGSLQERLARYQTETDEGR